MTSTAPWTAGTITSRRDLAAARVLAESFARHHPEIPFHLLLADELGGLFDPESERFRLVRLDQLDLDRPHEWCFRYPQPDLCYALPAAFARHLLDRGFARVLLLKNETMVLDDLSPIVERLATAAILLTPHLTAPLSGSAAAPREREILLAGVYNAGVLGVADHPAAYRFLAWWHSRLERHALRAVEEGMHHEQRWLDLVPSLFPPVAIERDPGANTGHWNLPQRVVNHSSTGGFTVDGRPLRVMRFSGFDPLRRQFATRHHERVRVEDLGAATALFTRYAEALDRHGDATRRAVPVSWAHFENGRQIPLPARAIHRSLERTRASTFGDPFRCGKGTYHDWLAARGPTGHRRLWLETWNLRPDLIAAFPEPEARDRAAFERWIAEWGRRETGIDDDFWWQPTSGAQR